MDNHSDTVLLVCSDEERSRDILERLVEGGFGVVGPAPNAALALALAAQAAPTVALVARPPTGRRDAAELADALMSQWGIGSVVLADALGEGLLLEDDPSWAPRPQQQARLRRALGVFEAEAGEPLH
ncbi:MAG TPA: hypothetical protein VEA79_13680 [Phenylobacterium sp.]|nr:hypothetical protein [Phenylobacterium sp.]